MLDYLEHMIEALDRIERYRAGFDLDSFLADEKTQDAVIRNIEIAGEAAGKTLVNIQVTASDFPKSPGKSSMACATV